MNQEHRRPVRVRRVDECQSVHEIFEHCLPAFGGAILRRVYTILDRAIGMGCPLTLSISGPVTVSGQHQAWLIPLLETGWVAYLSTTDAVCYHDGHRSLNAHTKDPIYEVPIFGDDGALRDEGVIRVTDMGFAEEVLLDQDKFLTAVLQRPEFQKTMTGTELRYLLGAFYGEQERRNGVQPGLLSTCYKLGVPVFVGAPSDGSVFLNSMKLWAMKQAGLIPNYAFDLDLHAEVFEACAYHYWGLLESDAKAMATLILGGGVPKNFNLQPEPALSQVLGIPNVRGYEFDVQITTAPVTDGSLSSCPPSEAVTWGKVDKDTYQQSTESLPGDYSTMMPFIVKALMEKHGTRPPHRLYERRERLVETLKSAVRENGDWLMESPQLPGGARMSKLTAFLILLACAVLEAGGDALARKGMHAGTMASRIGLYAAAAIVLFAYGWLVNRPPWSFGSLLGIYVVLFFVVAQVLAFTVFGERPTPSIAIGGLLIVSGGILITVMR